MAGAAVDIDKFLLAKTAVDKHPSPAPTIVPPPKVGRRLLVTNKALHPFKACKVGALALGACTLAMVAYAIYHTYRLHCKLSRLEMDRDPAFWADISNLPDQVLAEVRAVTSKQHAELQHLHSQQSMLMLQIGELEAHIQHHLQGEAEDVVVDLGASGSAGLVNEEVVLTVPAVEGVGQGIVIEEFTPVVVAVEPDIMASPGGGPEKCHVANE